MSGPLDLRLTDTAEADLAEIWAYVASESSEAAANRLIAKIADAFVRISEFPLGHPKRLQLGLDLRVAFSSRYAIYYQPKENEVIVLRVLHEARDIGALAERGGFST
ncbi:type II toxin-antitoxin system RelE/ParE family toxin [Rhodoblastus acidophilus]|uniref:type II toxin-antitoxin system RelE/ParE family toxin n=1 Tax=Rhodoblastus acidophilus TaxID=1074 RepID=UPI00222465A1|nr:type II toxin-antitoxin system RelE/ParE family toxin [Rhodoblastus acidophilus]